MKQQHHQHQKSKHTHRIDETTHTHTHALTPWGHVISITPILGLYTCYQLRVSLIGHVRHIKYCSNSNRPEIGLLKWYQQYVQRLSVFITNILFYLMRIFCCCSSMKRNKYFPGLRSFALTLCVCVCARGRTSVGWIVTRLLDTIWFRRDYLLCWSIEHETPFIFAWLLLSLWPKVRKENSYTIHTVYIRRRLNNFRFQLQSYN